MGTRTSAQIPIASCHNLDAMIRNDLGTNGKWSRLPRKIRMSDGGWECYGGILPLDPPTNSGEFVIADKFGESALADEYADYPIIELSLVN